MRKVALFVALVIAGVALALFLGGCATEPALLEGSGKEIHAPWQWQELCNEKPYLEICRPNVMRL